MGKILSLVMNKGGVGKTVTATSIAAILAKKIGPRRVLLVDGDHQGSCSTTFGLDPDTFASTVYEVLVEDLPVKKAIISLPDGLDLLPANDNLVALELQVLANKHKFPDPFHLLAKKLAPLRKKYDYIIIDSPPALSLMQGNIITASDEVLLVLQCEHLAVRGCKKVLETIEMIKEQHNPRLQVRGIIPTMVSSRSSLAKAVLEEADRYFRNSGITLFNTNIPRSVRFATAPAYRGKPAVLTDPANVMVAAYYDLVKEVFNIE